ncbi:putative amino acid permease [Streptomyces litmocidini]|uniref:APC family permease n=1 Tax=Streptomyces litmocidini TaxID=67318 RepID=UPI00167EA28C|nr:APC family permease [Streptomyces litmocidini]GGU96441.1 putative amino acid permease [Streptomyces litmocidini]
MTRASDTPPSPAPPPGKGLRGDSVGLLATTALGLASVAPAYSIAITLGLVILVVGDRAPAALLLGFVPILLTAFAFRELNRRMPDCGTTFVWNTRAFGPAVGWVAGGWTVLVATVLAMTALAQVGASALLAFLGLDTAAGSTFVVTSVAVLLIALVVTVAYRGIRLAAHVQYAMLGLQLLALLVFGVAAFARDGAAAPALSWVDPFSFDDFGSFAEAVLLCLFVYWGWDALITFNEETVDSGRTPGRAAIVSTLILLVTYLFTAFAAISFAGTGTGGLGLGDEKNAADVLTHLAPTVLGGAASRVVTLAIAVSAVGALLTCAGSTPRSTLSMSAHGALPPAFARMHPRFRTPAFGTVFCGTVAAVALVLLTLVSADFLGDAILSIGLLIAFYYGVTGFACAWHFRRQLRNSPRDLLVKGVLPTAGGLMMLAAFVRSAYDMADPGYGSTSVGGVGGVFLLGVGSIVLGGVVMPLVRIRHRRFFQDGRTAVATLSVTEN